MRANKLVFERRYSDGSGIEFAVRLCDSDIEFEHVEMTSFPVEEIDFLISALQRIKDEINGSHGISTARTTGSEE